jgi:hypothetical protein
MGLEMRVKRAILKELAGKYQRSSKKGKGQVMVRYYGLLPMPTGERPGRRTQSRQPWG